MSQQEAPGRLRSTFDGVATLYDQARPGYPERLFDDLVSLSGTGPGAKVLEIGCGTAQATVPLARRGYHVLCVELGDNLATIARGKLQSLFVGENETNGSHPLYGVGCRPGSTLGPPGRPDAAYAQTTWNDVLGSSRSPAPLHLLRAACADPSPASAPAGYVELAAVSLDYATPLLFVDQPRHGREESLPGALVEGPVAREAA